MKTATPWRSRIVGMGEEAPDRLLANPANWRLHPKAQQDALAGALDQVGWVQQVLVNRRSGFVIDGHARVALALSRGEATVPVLYVDLDAEEEALVLATLDPIGAMAEADEAKLRELLAGVAVDEAGLAALLRTLDVSSVDFPETMPPFGHCLGSEPSRAMRTGQLVVRDQRLRPGGRALNGRTAPYRVRSHNSE